MKLSKIFHEKTITLEEAGAYRMKHIAEARHVYDSRTLVANGDLEKAIRKLESMGYTCVNTSAYDERSWGLKVHNSSLDFKKDDQYAILALSQSNAQKKDGFCNAVLYRGSSTGTPISEFPHVTLDKFFAESGPSDSPPPSPQSNGNRPKGMR